MNSTASYPYSYLIIYVFTPYLHWLIHLLLVSLGFFICSLFPYAYLFAHSKGLFNCSIFPCLIYLLLISLGLSICTLFLYAHLFAPTSPWLFMLFISLGLVPPALYSKQLKSKYALVKVVPCFLKYFQISFTHCNQLSYNQLT